MRPRRLVGQRSRTSRAPASWLRTTDSAAPASRSARVSPTHRIGRRSCSRQRMSLRPTMRVGLTLISTALGVTDDGPRREARDHGRRDLTGVGATGLRVDVLGADGHAGAGQGCRDHRQADGGRADDSDDGRVVHGRGEVDRQLPGIGRRRVHLPVAGDDDRAHGRIIACGRPPTRGAPTPAARSSDSGRARPRGR